MQRGGKGGEKSDERQVSYARLISERYTEKENVKRKEQFPAIKTRTGTKPKTL